MKESATDHVILSENFPEALESAEQELLEQLERKKDRKSPKSDHIKQPIWMQTLIPSLSKIAQGMMPLMQIVKGAKQRVYLTTYNETCVDVEQIFNNYPNIFRTIPQLHALCHYIGVRVLQFLLITNRGIAISKFSQRLSDREPIREFRGKLQRMYEEIKSSVDQLNVGIITNDDLERDLDDFIDMFDTPQEKKIAARFIDSLFENGELDRGKNRLRVRKHREKERKHSDLKVV